MVNIMSRIKALWNWLAEPKYAWVALAIVFLALGICYSLICFGPYTSEPVIRHTGLVLQVFGIGTVAWGISDTRALFGHPSFVSKAMDWLSRFPLRRSASIVGLAGLSCGTVICSARGFASYNAGENPTIESRIDALEKNVDAINNRISETQNQIDQEVSKMTVALKQEELSRKEEYLSIREKLEATGTGGVHISAIGALWLFVGVILSTASPEIATLFK